MVFKIEHLPVLSSEVQELVAEAQGVHVAHHGKDVWFGRCIFLSFYCERGTCTFCFRSSKHAQQKNPRKAQRSLASIITEALLIRVFKWRIEFLTGGYGILEEDKLLRTIKLVSQAMGRKLWVNLGEIGLGMMDEITPYVEGIVSSIETVNPQLHDQVCPDKPIAPYEEMIEQGKKMGFKQSMTIIIGLGETREDFEVTRTFIAKHKFDRITIYALRPVAGTPFTTGPTSEELVWWIAQTRLAFPDIEIIVGTAEYRIPEIPLLLSAGANAITKLPATKIFNKDNGRKMEKLVRESDRNFTSKFTCEDVHGAANWDKLIDEIDLTDEEKKEVKKTLQSYLDMMSKKE